MTEITKKNYEKIRKNIENKWPYWKIDLCNKELLISEKSKKILQEG